MSTAAHTKAVQLVNEAVTRDSLGDVMNAYGMYLTSILYIAQSLKDAATNIEDIKSVCHDDSIKLIKLTHRCLDRIFDLLSGSKTDTDTSPNSYIDMINALPTPPGFSNTKTSPRYATPRQPRAVRGNMQQKQAAASYNLSLFRQQAEMNAISQAKRKALMGNMQLEAEKRWNKRKKASDEDKEFRQNLLAEVLAYEEEKRWPLTLRDTLAINNNDDAIKTVVEIVLLHREHPLGKCLYQLQSSIYQRIYILLLDHTPKATTQSLSIDRRNTPPNFRERKSTPPLVEQKSTSKTISPSIVTNMTTRPKPAPRYITPSKPIAAKRPTPPVKSERVPTPESTICPQTSLEDAFNDLEDEMFSDDSDPCYENTGTYVELKGIAPTSESDDGFSANVALSESLNNKVDSVYQCLNKRTASDDDNTLVDPNYNYCYQSSHMERKASTAVSNEDIYEVCGDYMGPESDSDDHDEAFKNSEEFSHQTHLQLSIEDVVKKLRFGIDRLYAVLLLVYDKLDTSSRKELVYATIEAILFNPLWPWIVKMFGKLNDSKEHVLNNVMASRSKWLPEELNVPQAFLLTGSEAPYSEAIEHIKEFVALTSPLEKLQSAVCAEKAVYDCIEKYWEEKNEKPPVVGGDDILPIMTYVVMKSHMPRLLSECQAIDNLIHESYLFGAEGYSLTIISAAANYLLLQNKPL